MSKLPAGMAPRLRTMLWFTLALGFTGFGDVNELAFMPFFGWVGAAIAMGMYAMWRDRTRPVPNGFWILMSILWFALALTPIRPYLGIVVTIPVALMWLHDSPGTPSAMLAWGMIATLSQDFDVWEVAGSDTAFFVVLAMVLFIAAAQAERQRLARAQYAPGSAVWMGARLGAIMLWSLFVVAGREGIQAMDFFVYLGFDLSGTAGKVTVLFLILVSLAMAAMLFRTRPHKYIDPYAQPRDDKGRRVAKDSKLAPKPAVRGTMDFDSGPSGKPVKAVKSVKAAKVAKAPAPRAAPAKPSKRTKPTQQAGALKPGEIDFD